jgi:hypothetical protein
VGQKGGDIDGEQPAAKRRGKKSPNRSQLSQQEVCTCCTDRGMDGGMQNI